MPKLGRYAFLAALVVLGAAGLARAESYPDRPVTLIVPFPPGGSTDIIARIVADKLSEALGQPIVVENRGGAGGTVGTRAAAKSAADGYTLLLSYTGTLAIGPSLYANVGYDPRKDFAPVGRIGTAPSMLLAHPSFPAHSVAELIGYAKANPGKVNYGTAGVGTVGHIAGEYLATLAGIKLTHIPYKGTGAVMTDLLGGHILLGFAPIPAGHSNVLAGSLRALAVTSASRSTLVPDIPTIAETLPGFDAVLLYGLVAPAGTPRPIIERLNQELRKAVSAEDVRRRFATEGAEPLASTPQEYAVDIDREETKWSQVVKVSGAKGE
ncbi:MAG: Bug family tripartite tricarboxylate transporter substrate binding protein [Xanthobacteraceae bacterium]